MFVSVNHKNIRYEPSESELEEYKSRIRKAMYRQDREINEREADIKRRGTCPKCHMVLPLTKYCSKCQIKY